MRTLATGKPEDATPVTARRTSAFVKRAGALTLRHLHGWGYSLGDVGAMSFGPALSCFAPRPVSRSRPVGLQSLSRLGIRNTARQDHHALARGISNNAQHSCGLHEKVALALGVLDALAGYGEVSRIALNPDEVAAHLNSGNARGTGTHKWIED